MATRTERLARHADVIAEEIGRIQDILALVPSDEMFSLIAKWIDEHQTERPGVAGPFFQAGYSGHVAAWELEVHLGDLLTHPKIDDLGWIKVTGKDSAKTAAELLSMLRDVTPRGGS